MPGVSVDTIIKRTYNSKSTEKSIFGLGWSTDFDMELLRKVSDNEETDNMVLKYGDGSIYEFQKNEKSDETISYISSLGKYVNLIENESLNIENFKIPSSTSSEEENIEVRCKYIVTDKNYNEYRFNEEGKLVYIGSSDGNYVLPVYDTNTGLLSKCISNKGIMISFEYNKGRDDGLGTVSEVNLPDGSSFRYSYDGDPSSEDVKLTSVTRVGTDGSEITYTYGYSDKGMTSFTDGEGNKYQVSYDDKGRVSSLENPEKKTIRLDISDNSSKTVTSVYNERGLTNNLLYEEKDWFDGWFGNVMKSEDASGVVTEYTYEDNLLQMTKTLNYWEELDGSNVSERSSSSYEITKYDKNENIDKLVTESSVTKYETNENGDVLSEVTTNSDGNISADEESEYDDDGNMTWSYDEIEDESEISSYYGDEDEANGELKSQCIKTGDSKDTGGDLISKSNYTYDYSDDGKKTVTETAVEDGITTVTKTVTDAMGRELSENVTVNGDTSSDTVNTYDGFGRIISSKVTSTKNGKSSTKTTYKEYDRNGTVTSETAEDGTRTDYVYDDLNRVTKEVVSKGSLSKSTLTAYSYADTEILKDEESSSTVKNAYVTTKKTDGGSTNITWQDASGNTVKKYENGLYTYSTFDKSGHEIGTYEGGSDSSGTGVLTVNLYDVNGNNMATIKNASLDGDTYIATDDSTVSTSEYDSNNNITKSKDEKGNVTVMTYSDNNKLTSLSSPSGAKTKFKYETREDGSTRLETNYAGGARSTTLTNERGLDIENTDYLDEDVGIRIKKTYDEEGNLVREDELCGNHSVYSYDENNLVTSKESYDASGNQTLELDYEYDRSDRLILAKTYEVLDGDKTNISSVRYTYDDFGRKKSFKEWHGGSEPENSTGVYSYDAEDRVINITYATDSEASNVEYVYNDNGWLDRIKVGSKILRLYEYDNLGRVISMTDTNLSGGSTTREYTYDNLSRVTKMKYYASNSEETLEEYSYGYDKAGNIISESLDTNYDSVGTDIHRTRKYEYSEDGYLTKVSNYTREDEDADIDSITPEVTEYRYDEAGNRTKKTSGSEVTTSEYNSLNQLVSSETTKDNEKIGSKSYLYDKNGNETSEEDEITGEKVKMNYNAVNQMTSLTRSKGDDVLLTQTNTYNGEGQRIRKLETSKKSNVLAAIEDSELSSNDSNGEESSVSNSEDVTTSREYYYQDGSVLYTTDGSSQNDFNVIGATGNIIASSKISGEDENWYLYNKDTRGSITSITDGNSKLSACYDYDEFGNTEVLAGEDFDNEFGYTGQVYDMNSGLYYYNARYYDSETGRFTSQDTKRAEVNEPDTYHLYAYCANNPINYVDPSGNFRLNAGKVAVVIDIALTAIAPTAKWAYDLVGKSIRHIMKKVSKTRLKKFIISKIPKITSKIKKIRNSIRKLNKRLRKTIHASIMCPSVYVIATKLTDRVKSLGTKAEKIWMVANYLLTLGGVIAGTMDYLSDKKLNAWIRIPMRGVA